MVPLDIMVGAVTLPQMSTTVTLMSWDCAFTITRRKNTEEADDICSLTRHLLIFFGPNGKLSCMAMRAEQQKAPSVCVSASEAHDWSASPPARRSPPGKDGWIHDSFCNEGEKKKKKESACERRNSPDHWEIIRWSGMVDVELNGIINQAKKQARCSYIYYLHVFHFRRSNKQTYVGAADLCSRHLEAAILFLTADPQSASGTRSARHFFIPLTEYHLGTILSASGVISTTSRTSSTESCCRLPVL